MFFSQCEHHVVSASVLKITGRLKESHGTAQRPPCKYSFYVTNFCDVQTYTQIEKILKTVDTKEAVRNETGTRTRKD